MTNEELLKKIEEIEKDFSILPDQMKWLEVDVPLMIEVEMPNLILDPTETKMIPNPKKPTIKKKVPHPKKRVSQRRMDLIDANDPFKQPLSHYHKYPDHPAYNPDSEAHGNIQIKTKPTVFFLTQKLKEFLIKN